MQLFHLAELKSLYGLQQKATYKRLHRLKAMLAFDGNHCLLLKEVCSHVKAALKACGWAVCPTGRGSRNDLDPSSALFPKEGGRFSHLQQGTPSGLGVQDYLCRDAGVGP